MVPKKEADEMHGHKKRSTAVLQPLSFKVRSSKTSGSVPIRFGYTNREKTDAEDEIDRKSTRLNSSH